MLQFLPFHYTSLGCQLITNAHWTTSVVANFLPPKVETSVALVTCMINPVWCWMELGRLQVETLRRLSCCLCINCSGSALTSATLCLIVAIGSLVTSNHGITRGCWSGQGWCSSSSSDWSGGGNSHCSSSRNDAVIELIIRSR